MIKRSKIEDREVFAIFDFSDKTLVERTRRVARSRRGTLLSLSGPNPDADVSISRSEDADLTLDISKFNEQRLYFEEGSSVREWDGGPFHLGNELVLAAWACGELGAKKLTMVGEHSTSNPFVTRALSSIVEEYGLPLSFTHSTNVVTELKNSDLQYEKDESMLYPYEVERVDNIYDNKFFPSLLQDANSVEVIEDRREPSSDVEVCVRWGEGKYGKNADLRCIQSTTENLLKIPRTNVLLLEGSARECIRICEDYHSIYLPSDEVKKAISRIKRSELGEVDRLNLATKTVLVVAMASDYEELRTHGVLEAVSRKERQFLKRIESIDHD